eukprot:g5542.t1
MGASQSATRMVFHTDFENSSTLFPRSSDVLAPPINSANDVQLTPPIPRFGAIYNHIVTNKNESKKLDVKTETPEEDGVKQVTSFETASQLESGTECLAKEQKSLKSFPVTDIKGVAYSDTASVVSNFNESSLLSWSIAAPVQTEAPSYSCNASSNEIFLDWSSTTSYYEESSVISTNQSLFSPTSAVESSFQSCEISEEILDVYNQGTRDQVRKLKQIQSNFDEILQYLVVNWRWVSSCLVWTLLLVTIVVVLSLGTHDKIKGTSFILPGKQKSSANDSTEHITNNLSSENSTVQNTTGTQSVLQRRQKSIRKTNSTRIVQETISSTRREGSKELDAVLKSSEVSEVSIVNDVQNDRLVSTVENSSQKEAVIVDDLKHHQSLPRKSRIKDIDKTPKIHTESENIVSKVVEPIDFLEEEYYWNDLETNIPQSWTIDALEASSPMIESTELQCHDNSIESSSPSYSWMELYYDQLMNSPLMEMQMDMASFESKALEPTEEIEWTVEPENSYEPLESFEVSFHGEPSVDTIDEALHAEWHIDHGYIIEEPEMAHLILEVFNMELDYDFVLLMEPDSESTEASPSPTIVSVVTPFIEEEIRDIDSPPFIAQEETNEWLGSNYQTSSQPILELDMDGDNIEDLNPPLVEVIFHKLNDSMMKFSDMTDSASIANYTLTGNIDSVQPTPNVVRVSDGTSVISTPAVTSQKQNRRGVWQSSCIYTYRRKRRFRSNVLPQIMIQSSENSSIDESPNVLPELEVVTGRTNIDQVPEEELNEQQRHAEARRDLDSAAGRKSPSLKCPKFNGVYFPFKSVTFSLTNFAPWTQRSNKKTKISPS